MAKANGRTVRGSDADGKIYDLTHLLSGNSVNDTFRHGYTPRRGDEHGLCRNNGTFSKRSDVRDDITIGLIKLLSTAADFLNRGGARRRNVHFG